MQIPVGHYSYELLLVPGYVDFFGAQALGKCDSEKRRIEIASAASPQKRISVAWHELSHAWHAELFPGGGRAGEVGGQVGGDDEQLADLVGLAMSAMTPADIARMIVYLTREIDCKEVLILPGSKAPIPLLGGII